MNVISTFEWKKNKCNCEGIEGSCICGLEKARIYSNSLLQCFTFIYIHFKHNMLWVINLLYIKVKICVVWVATFSFKCVLIEFAIPNMSLICIYLLNL